MGSAVLTATAHVVAARFLIMGAVPGTWHATLRRRAYDIAAVVLAVLGIGQLLLGPTPMAAIGLATVVAAAGCVFLLPRWPLVGVIGIVVVVLTAHLWSDTDPPFAAFLSLLLAVYTLARYETGLRLLVGYGVTLMATATVAVRQISTGRDSAFGTVILTVYLAIATLIGVLARQRAGYNRAVLERAEAIERDRRHLAELAAAAERTRLARELHDVVSHGVSLMSLQAEAAREVIEQSPERAAQTLEAIGETGRRTITDLHRMLGLLQDPTLPLGNLSDHIRAILDPLDELGIAAQVIEVGQPRRLPPSLPPVVHRIVQESITNVIKHAGASEVMVQLIYRPDMFCIELSDQGGSLARPRPESGVTPAGGFGISGMRVRVEEAGGTFIAGRHDEGFTVRASFPTSDPLHTDPIGIDSAHPPSESSPTR